MSLLRTTVAPAVAPATAPPAAAPAGASSAPGFQALLERLQKLASPAAEVPEVATPDALRDAVRAADSSFATAMDLRRQLEDAFRRHGS
jgi:hypothetical protein